MENEVKGLLFVRRYTVLAGLFTLTSCGVNLSSLINSQEPENIVQTDLTVGVATLAVNINKYPANKIVCDPLSGGQTTQTQYTNGIKASLHYKLSNQPRMYKSTDYAQFAFKSEQNLFLSDMNVPTRMFSEGFSTQTGDTLKDDQGQKLIEYFGLKMNSNIILSADDEEGSYEFAMLADDGTQMLLKSEDPDVADQVLIDNDGDHPTKMGCSKKTVQFSRNSMVPFEATYYQGPRYHISNVLMWRKSTTSGQDPSCNKLGNSLYFNPDKNSEEQPAFKDLISRGWKVLKPSNFAISKTTEDYNPCVVGTNPVISNFEVGEVILTMTSVSWVTDIPATSQVQLTNTKTNQVTVTTSDNQLRTSHQISLSELQPNTIYKVKVISVSSDLGRSESGELTFQTQ